jgi:glycosyltransferase involved in cell wall biosynthesis
MARNRKQPLILQHHAESPSGFSIKRTLQRDLNPKASAYIFTSIEQSLPFIKAKYIRAKELVHEIMEGSHDLKKTEHDVRIKNSFIWVGRLNTNKDPITVLKAFARFKKEKEFKLTMIYSQNDLEKEVSQFIVENALEVNVTLLAKVNHGDMALHYSTSEFYISASHQEGSGWALSEALACGCIPIISNIPSFMKMTDNGRIGFSFEPGNDLQLLHVLKKLDNINHHYLSDRSSEYFESELSFKAIAGKYRLLLSLLIK